MLLKGMVALFSAYAGLAGLAFFAQRRMIFPSPAPRELALAGETLVRFAGADGRAQHAIYRAAPANAPTVVFFHGNGEQLADMTDVARVFAARGLGVFAVEYPGYGPARDQETSEQAIYQTAEDGLRYLDRELGVPATQTVLVGQSLGTGVAVEMAARGYGSKLVLISPFTSMVDMAQRLVPIFPARLLVRHRFESAAKAPRIALPVLIFHGVEDELVPVEMGKKMAALFPNARLELLEHAHHNDVFIVPGEPIPAGVARFVRVSE